MYYYSPSKNGFYLDSIHKSIPNDGVAITAEEYTALLDAQSSGAVIVPGADGKPTAFEGQRLTLTEVQAAMRVAIRSGFDAAITASLTMPSAGTSPSAYEVATALFDWRTDDPEGYAALLAIHTARRDELLAAVDAATTPEAVQAIAVSYAV